MCVWGGGVSMGATAESEMNCDECTSVAVPLVADNLGQPLQRAHIGSETNVDFLRGSG